MADSDFVRIHMRIGAQDLRMVDLGFTWPPPERLLWDAEDDMFREPNEFDNPDLIFIRTNMSRLTNEHIEKVGKHVIRGAEYRYEANLPTRH